MSWRNVHVVVHFVGVGIGMWKLWRTWPHGEHIVASHRVDDPITQHVGALQQASCIGDAHKRTWVIADVGFYHHGTHNIANGRGHPGQQSNCRVFATRDVKGVCNDECTLCLLCDTIVTLQ